MAHVVFIHGLSNKPPSLDLHRLWKRGLAKENGIDLATDGIESTMVYWADVFYSEPDRDAAATQESSDTLVTVAQAAAIDGSELLISNKMPPAEEDFVRRLAGRVDVEVTQMEIAARTSDSPVEGTAVYEMIPLPGFLKERIMASFVQEAYAFLFDKESNPRPGVTYRVREELRRRFVTALKNARASSPNEPVVVVAHSMGTMIAYDCLKRVPDCPSIDELVTVGSPLGIDEVQEGFLPEWTRSDGFPSQKLLGKWTNIFDPFDVVARLDPRLANDYCQAGVPVIEDIEEENWGPWRHNITHYLQGKKLRSALKSVLGI